MPWYNLPALHARLMEEPAYASRLVMSPSYTGPGCYTQVAQPFNLPLVKACGPAVASWMHAAH